MQGRSDMEKHRKAEEDRKAEEAKSRGFQEGSKDANRKM